MNIAIQAADLDSERIDGTRIYLLRLLERFGTLSQSDTWHIFHKTRFNPDLTPPILSNYIEHRIRFPVFWTQTRFLAELFRLRPDRLFMPVQTVPFLLPQGTRSIVTIHDLAFRIFPQYFPSRDRRRLTWFTDAAIRNADRIIAVSESTKSDILRFYPNIPESKIRVIYHGFDLPNRSTLHSDLLLQSLNIEPKRYLLYVGALQPRKNLLKLLEAFGILAEKYKDMKLVLAGEPAWMSKEIIESAKQHPHKDRVILTGKISFAQRTILYKNASIFVFPSLYEGFGLPLLEAFAAGTPVVAAKNSSISEISGDAAKLFETNSLDSLVDATESIWNSATERQSLIERGERRLPLFSWDRCAKDTADWIRL